MSLTLVLVIGYGTEFTTAAGGKTNSPLGLAPPEWSASGSAWPAFGHDLANTRATFKSSLNARTVSHLKEHWAFRFKGTSAYGDFASTPIVVESTIYLQDLNSNVYALDPATGRVIWRHTFNKIDFGPNGIAYGWGRIYGATQTRAFALDAKTGKLIWSRTLVHRQQEGIDFIPQVYDNTVVVSTVPVTTNQIYGGGADGIVYALHASRGKVQWTFNTVSDGYKLWGNPRVNSGGGLWYPPAVDSHRRIFLSVANPGPVFGTKKYPNASSRPGPNLYTDSLVVLNGRTGKLLWYHQVLPHDVRDYDLQVPAILTSVVVDGVSTEVALVAGKMGKVYAFRAADGKALWSRAVGKHRHDTGSLPAKAVNVYPGVFGGVETPMALAKGRLFVPWVNLPASERATGVGPHFSLNFNAGRGGIDALDATTGRPLWQHALPAMDVGGAAVANDVVFTSTYAGSVYAFSTKTGKQLWSAKAPAGINSFAAIDGNTLLVGAATNGTARQPRYELLAYSLK